MNCTVQYCAPRLLSIILIKVLELSGLPTTEHSLCETYAATFLDIFFPQWLIIRIFPKTVELRAQCVLMCHPVLPDVEETTTRDGCTFYG